MEEITCMCEHKFSVDITREIDLQKDPSTLDEITDGSFLNITCPSCHTVLKPEFPVRIFDRVREWDIEFVPELDRHEFLKKLAAGTSKKNERVVIGYPELVEKVKCFRDNLDDRVIEYLKYFIFSKILEKTENDENETTVYYYEKKGEELIYHIQGLKHDEVGLFKIPFPTYKKACAEIEKQILEEPFNEFLVPPYVSLKNLYSWSDL